MSTATPAPRTLLHAYPIVPSRHTTAAETFFRALFGERRGWMELAWIDGDPDDRMHSTFGREWVSYDGTALERLVARVDQLAECYGNVYVSAQLYQSPRRNADVLPGRAVVVDDAPLDLACSFSVRTSPSSKHAYFLLDHDTGAEQLRDLSRRAAYAVGADRSGWDSQQLVRVPGTYNTKAKHGGRYLVTLQREQWRKYRAQELDECWPTQMSTSTNSAVCDWPEVELWLGNLDLLIGLNRLPRRVKPTTQTGRVLLQEMEDSSLARYIVAKGLALHGYPDAEIMALLWHYCDYGKATEKGTAWLRTDIERILSKVRAELPRIEPSPTRYATRGTPQPIAPVQPPKRGRKIMLTPTALLEFYTQAAACSDVVLLTVSEVAERLRVSRATIERCERALRAEGAIERRHFNRRQSSLVAILRPVTNAAGQNLCSAPALESGQQTDQRPVTTTQIDALPPTQHVPSHDNVEAQQDAENAAIVVVGGTHPPDATPQLLGPVLPMVPLSPRAAIAEAFAHFAQRRRITRQMLVMFLQSKYPELRVAPQALDRLIHAERSRQLWNRQIASLGTIPYAKLACLSRKIDRVLADGLQGREHTQRG